ncbi:3-dehydroquinate synthase [Candidatus Viridilinea mediisalina]|uniref:3-dehydroquinate synthase n=1 Tax=Candidatus Viridilinea mediisalina TaxID=2024553 RepID=A0A2A6RHN0_9CHLR|nr:3-dehydroquinate synthase [Candidatus Viridilinea mediisalina]PDW02634.1 3-dehydroquinate synthase [Candidatus Viridilinea mediisalina]
MPNDTLTVTTSTSSYPVIVAEGALHDLPQHLANLAIKGRVWLISDTTVFPLHGLALCERLRAAGYTVESFALPAGEASKNGAQLGQLYDWMLGGAVERRDIVLALGGGVVGDLAGFAAASVLRGIALVQLPTTLLAMVDAAVGGKTGINHALGKNLIGAFHQPRLVLADTATLASLPPRELRAGWAEVIKHGVISDARLYAELQNLAADLRHPALPDSSEGINWTPGDPRLTAIIRRAVAVKVGVVIRDEREQGERITLNYGHTIGHAIEALTGYGTLLHGEAVAIGMHAAARIAACMGLCDLGLVKSQRALLHAYGLPTALPAALEHDAIIATTLRDKKVEARNVRWVLPTAIGNVVVRDDVPEALVRTALS